MNNREKLEIHGLKEVAQETECIKPNSGNYVEVSYNVITGQVDGTFKSGVHNFISPNYRNKEWVFIAAVQGSMNEKELANLIYKESYNEIIERKKELSLEKTTLVKERKYSHTEELEL